MKHIINILKCIFTGLLGIAVLIFLVHTGIIALVIILVVVGIIGHGILKIMKNIYD